jgi:hypothetical protein
LNIMGLNTGTQSEKSVERKGGENISETIPCKGPKTGLFYSGRYPLLVIKGKHAPYPELGRKLHLRFTPRVNAVLTPSRTFQDGGGNGKWKHHLSTLGYRRGAAMALSVLF